MIEAAQLSGDALDQLMPMHVQISSTGHITHAAPTLCKMRKDVELAGVRFLEVFEIRRPRNINTMSSFETAVGQKVHLKFRDAPNTSLKGTLVELPDGGYLLNLSFGISVIEGVRDYGLTIADFASTDLTVEMLYLVEAKTAVMEELHRLNRRLQGARVAAEEQAFTDTLTGLKNRRALDHVLLRYSGNDAAFGLMQLDLDYFKKVNDTHGHAAGDLVLQQVAIILVEETRQVDTVARVGGDEFVLVFADLTNVGELCGIGERIIRRLEEPVIFDGKPCVISGSIGISTTEMYKTPTPETMMADGDAALYASKNKGRACVTVVTPEHCGPNPDAAA